MIEPLCGNKVFSTTYSNLNTVIKKLLYGCLLFCVKFAFYSHKKICSSRRTCKCIFFCCSIQHCFCLHFFCIEIMNDIKQNHHHGNEGLNYTKVLLLQASQEKKKNTFILFIMIYNFFAVQWCFVLLFSHFFLSFCNGCCCLVNRLASLVAVNRHNDGL